MCVRVCKEDKVLLQTTHSCFMGGSPVCWDFVLWDALSGLAPDLGFLSIQQNLHEQKEFNNKSAKLNCFIDENK